MTTCQKQEKLCTPMYDAKNMHPMGNRGYANVCSPCPESVCKDIQEGTFEFSGPAILLGVCNIHKSYLITRAVDGDCEVRAGAIFPDSMTSHFDGAPSMEFSLAGDYTVKYKWDACCELEPQFEALPYPCPCA